MIETINVIERSLSEKQEMVARLKNEQDKLIAALSENFNRRIALTGSIQRQEIELKQLYELYHQKSDVNYCTTAKNVGQSVAGAITYNSQVFQPDEPCHSFKPTY